MDPGPALRTTTVVLLLLAPLPAVADSGDPGQGGTGTGYTLAFGPTFDEHGVDINSKTEDHDTVNLSSDEIQWSVILHSGFRPLVAIGTAELGYFLEYEFKTVRLEQSGEIDDFGGTTPTIHPDNEVSGWYASFNPILALRLGRSTIGVGPGIGYLNLEGDFMVGWWDRPATTEPLRIKEIAKVFTFQWEYTLTHFLLGMRVNFFEDLGDDFYQSFTAAHLYAGYRFAL